MAVAVKRRLEPNPVIESVTRKLVEPADFADKSGCLWCPLAVFHSDFSTISGKYQREADKIKKRQKDGHFIKCRNIREPWTPCDILFVNEAPGTDEDNKGLPLVGREGKLLNTCIEGAIKKIPRERIGITNLVRCRTPRNKPPKKTDIESCSPELIREIKSRKPKVVVIFGNAGLEFLTGLTGYTNLAGKFVKCSRPEFPDLMILGCFSPGYVLFNDHLLQNFLDTLELAESYVKGTFQPLPGMGTYHVLDDIVDIVSMFKKFKKEKRRVAFDTETGNKHPKVKHFPNLLCFGFSNCNQVGYTIPWDHKDSPFRVACGTHDDGPKAHQRKAVLKELKNFFGDAEVEKVAQNEKFDRQHIREEIGLEPEGVVEDTLLKHLTINEEEGTHGLEVLCYAYTGMGGYFKPLDNYIKAHKDCNPRPKKGKNANKTPVGSYYNIPGGVLFPYCAMDCDCTYRVDEALESDEQFKSNPSFQRLSKTFFIHLSRVLADMEYQGAQVDPEVVKILDEKYSKEMSRLEKEIQQLPMVKKFEADQIAAGKTGKKRGEAFVFNPGSPQQLSKILFEYYKLDPIEMTDTGLSRMAARHAKRIKEARDKGEAPPSFHSTIKIATDAKEWDFFTTKADVLHEYERAGNDLATPLLKYRDAATLWGTFVVPLKTMLDSDGRIHGSYLIHGTVTGRLASREPNLQNIPNKGGGLIKQAYISRFGSDGLILNVDFSQVELRIAAAYYKEPTMVQAYVDGKDLHTLTAADIAFPNLPVAQRLTKFLTLPKDKQKEWRTRAKRVNFGVLYGGGPPALMTTLKKDGVFVTQDECKTLITNYFKARPKLRAGMDKAEAKVRRDGFLDSFTGRRRRVPEVFSSDNQMASRALRQMINYPIQEGAGTMTMIAMVLIHWIMKAEGFKSIMFLNVHDSIVFDCVKDEVIAVAKLAKEIMENLPKYTEEVLPGLDWRWLNVPIIAECEAGKSYGTMVEFDPFEVEAGAVVGTSLYKTDDKGKTDLARKPANFKEFLEGIEWKRKQKAVA